MGIEAILALGGLVIPPAVDFIKKKFLKGQDTPEATLSALATTKPDVMPMYIEAQAKMLIAQKDYFNRDVCGTPSNWVVNLRASIRPIGVVIAFIILSIMSYMYINNTSVMDSEMVTGTRYACIAIITSWFGDRLAK